MSQLRRLIKKPARASRGAVKSAAATAALLQTSCDLTDIKETDGCMRSCTSSSIIPLYTEEEEEVVCLHWQGWLKVFNPPGPLNPTLYTPTTTLCTDCPRHDSPRWSFCSGIDYGTPLLHQGTQWDEERCQGVVKGSGCCQGVVISGLALVVIHMSEDSWLTAGTLFT